MHKVLELSDILLGIILNNYLIYSLGCYNKTYEPGTYVCVVCAQPLFSSDTKYDSGCGWPAFNDVLDKGRVKLSPDTSGGNKQYIV